MSRSRARPRGRPRSRTGSRPRAIAAAAVAGVVALSLTACEAAAERLVTTGGERLIESATDGEVDLDLETGGFSAEGPDGEVFSVGATSEIPQRIAAAIAIPEGFEPVHSFETSDDGQRATSVFGVMAGVAPVDVVDDIEAQLASDGWDPEGRTNMNDEVVGIVVQKAADGVTVTAIGDGSDTMVTFALVEDR